MDRFCGSFKLFATDGSPIRHDRCWMALALRNGQEYNGHEIVIERPDGERISVLAHANPIRDDSGKVVGAANVLVDITDRKRANRLKDQFLAMISHDLRNPVHAILGWARLLRTGQITQDAQAQALDIIERKRPDPG